MRSAFLLRSEQVFLHLCREAYHLAISLRRTEIHAIKAVR